MPKPLSALLLALLLIGCASTQLSARRNIVPQTVAQSGQVCPTQPAVMCIAVTVTPGVSPTPTDSIITRTAIPSATAAATATQTPWPTPTQIVGVSSLTPIPREPERGGYSPYYQQRVRAGPGVNHPQTGWIGGGSVWQVEVLEYSTGDKWGLIEDYSRGIVGWVAIIHTGLAYGVFTPD